MGSFLGNAIVSRATSPSSSSAVKIIRYIWPLFFFVRSLHVYPLHVHAVFVAAGGKRKEEYKLTRIS